MDYSLFFLILPALLVPFLVKGILIRIVFYVLKRNNMPFIHSLVYEGWNDQHIDALMDQIIKFAYRRTNRMFNLAYTLINDGKQVLYMVQQSLSKNPGAKDPHILRLDFTPERLIQCILLFLNDMYREYGNKWWFKRILTLRLHWFSRADFVKRAVKQVFSAPLLKTAMQSRLIGPIVRFLVIPLIGPPVLAFYLVRSFVISLAWEGWVRYLYSILLIRFAYYLVFLYVRRNSLIEHRLSMFSDSKISRQSRHFSDLLNPSLWKEKSARYPQAVTEYLKFLCDNEYPVDRKVLGLDEKAEASFKGFGAAVQRGLSRIFSSTKTAFKKQLDMHIEPDHLKQLSGLFHTLGNAYYPGRKPLYWLSLHDVIIAAYTGSLYFLSRIYKAPVSSPLLKTCTIDVLIKMKDVAQTDLIQYALKTARFSGKLGSTLYRARKGFTLVKSGSGAAGLILSFTTPLLYQHLEDSLRTYMIHRFGRILLLLFEESTKTGKHKFPLESVF
ncbi:MAG: hypothetical protein JXB03_11550 [Spirochaetales bacterium]|nr:hypothetical protein [Spirochaetales bacterium]